MARLSIVPSDVTFSSTGLPRIECEINLDGSFEGKSVTLAVCDRAIYLGTPAAQAEVQAARGADKALPLPGFMADNYMLDPVVGPPGNTGSGTNPDVKIGTGVLFVAEGVLKRTPSKKWFLQVTGRKEVSNPTTPVELQTRDETGRMTKLGIIGYFADEPTRAADRTLLFRLARTGIGGGQVIAASLGKQGGGRCAAVTLHVPSGAADSSAHVGGAPIPGNFETPVPVSRALPFDLTGFYDSIDDPSLKRPLQVQINQAGRRFAGWAMDVPRGMPAEIRVGATGKKAIKRKPEALKNGRSEEVPLTRVVFAGDVNAGSAWPFTWWMPSETGASFDPEREPAELSSKALEASIAGRGKLILAPGASISEPNPKLMLWFDTPYGASEPWTIICSRKEARWPTALIDALPSLARGLDARLVTEAQEYLRATQVQPIPSCYWTHVENILSTGNAALVGAIDAWRISSLALRTLAREKVAAEVENVFAGFEGAGYESVIRDRARAIAMMSHPPLDGGRRSILEWLELVVSDHWDRISTNPENVKANLSPEALYQNVDLAFRRLGVRPKGRFRYTFTFQQIEVGTPQFIVGLTVGGFTVTITRSEFMDESGTTFEDPSFGTCRLMGAVLDLKAGLGAAWSVGVGGPLEGSMVFESVAKLSPADFQSATVKQVSVAVLEGSALGIGGSALASNYMIVSLANGFELTASTADTLSPKFEPTLEITKLKLKDLAKLDFSFNVVVVHSAMAILRPMETIGPKFPSPDQPGGIRKLSRDVSRETNILFDYDSAKLMARDELELRLAVDRRLFTHGDGVAGASGFASPEGRADYNMRLSLARAAAIIQAVRDAFGETLTLTQIRGRGFGEDAALRAGLLNPPGKSEGETQRILREATSQWPSWRKVELRVEGVLVAQVMGRGAGGPP